MADSAVASRRIELPWRGVVLAALGTWAASRLGLVLFTVFHGAFTAAHGISVAALASAWVQWDGRWYLAIAQDPYTTAGIAGPVFCPCDGVAATRFFPLYPLLVRALNLVLGGHQLVFSGLLLSNLALLAALVGIGLLFVQEYPGQSPRLALLLVVAYPLGFALASPFSEALFLALAVYCLLWLRRGRWRLAAAAAFLAALTRPSAIALVLPLFWEFARGHGWFAPGGGVARARVTPRVVLDGALVLAAIPAGYVVFMVFLGSRFGDPLIGLRTHAAMNEQHLVAPWLVLARMVTDLGGVAPEWLAMRAVDLGAIVGVAAVTIWGRRDLPTTLLLYVAGLVVLHLSVPSLGFFGGDILASGGRYMTATIPAFMVLGRRLKPGLSPAIAVVCAGWLLQAALLVRFFNGGYVA